MLTKINVDKTSAENKAFREALLTNLCKGWIKCELKETGSVELIKTQTFYLPFVYLLFRHAFGEWIPGE